MVFFDTNIFLYVVSAAEADQEKKRVAESLIASHEFGLSVQVIQEFMDAASKKKHLGLLPQEIEEMVASMVKNPVLETSITLAREAFRLKLRFQIAYWDAAIIAAARELGCDTLYSEDLNHGQDYGGVVVKNPFL